MTSASSPDLAALKLKQQAAWASGDYSVIGTTLQIVGEQLAEACDVRCDDRVLDVAAGNGNASLAAARRGGRVTSTDYVPGLLDRGAERARAERLDNFVIPPDSTSDVLLDVPYSASSQLAYPVVPPAHIAAGDVVTATCKNKNTTGAPVTYGESVDAEQCFVGIYATPPRTTASSGSYPLLQPIYGCMAGTL